MKTGIRFLIILFLCALPGSLSAQQGVQRAQRTPEETAKA
jgi:hypothetical protein